MAKKKIIQKTTNSKKTQKVKSSQRKQVKKKKQSKKKQKGKKFRWIYASLIVVFALVIGGVIINAVLKNKKSSSISSTSIPVGPVNLCRKNPKFTTKYGLKPPFFIDLRQQEYKGLAIREARENGKALQLPEWDDFGYLGPYALDKKGNIYTSSVPYVSLFDNPPKEQNKIYIIESPTGKMNEYMNMPWAKEPSPKNPFGVVGLAYDCDTESLYASSLAGSSFKDEIGRIYQIDLKTKQIISQFEGVDAIGIGVFNGKNGKRLYFGSARKSEVYSIALDDKGSFSGDSKYEFSLIEHGGSFDNGHRIRFFQDNHMEVKGIEFSFSLIAASDPLRNIYNFDYDAKTDSWKFREVHKQ